MGATAVITKYPVQRNAVQTTVGHQFSSLSSHVFPFLSFYLCHSIPPNRCSSSTRPNSRTKYRHRCQAVLFVWHRCSLMMFDSVWPNSKSDFETVTLGDGKSLQLLLPSLLVRMLHSLPPAQRVPLIVIVYLVPLISDFMLTSFLLLVVEVRLLRRPYRRRHINILTYIYYTLRVTHIHAQLFLSVCCVYCTK